MDIGGGSNWHKSKAVVVKVGQLREVIYGYSWWWHDLHTGTLYRSGGCARGYYLTCMSVLFLLIGYASVYHSKCREPFA